VDKIVIQRDTHVPIGSEEGSNQFGFQIYPNPALSSFKIKYQASPLSPVKFEIYDLLGRLVRSFNEISVSGVNQTDIDVSNLTSGNYFIKLISDTRVQTDRIQVVK
jgi:hypothetical protein